MISESEAGSVLDTSRLEAELDIQIDHARFNKIFAETPPALRPIAHYAAIWGISDDGYRAQFISHANKDACQNLKNVVYKNEDNLDEWLAGKEANGPHFSEAYIAFSCMRMASDEIQ